MTRPVTSTYRLQLNSDFGFAAASEQVPYLAELGVSHLYLSPLLKARTGSTHGYDVVDPTVVSPALGGEEGLRELADTAHAAGLGLVVDIVPNHLGIGPENPWWELLLADGRAGDGGRVFDVDWGPPLPTADNKVILPVLGDQYGEVLHCGHLTVDDSGREPRLRYFEQTFPLSSETHEAIERAGGTGIINGRAGEPSTWTRLHGLLENQHYRLVFWRLGDRLINYRRFFAINDLAGVRVEDDHVFDLMHGTILRLVAEGVIDGLRIDHPDGLRHPAAYLERLHDRTGGLWTVVEKITHPGEQLPADWKTAGTTGYEFVNDVLGLFVDPDARKDFDALDLEMGGSTQTYADQVLDAKCERLANDFAADIQRLARRFWALCQHHLEVRDIDEASCYEVVSRMVVRLPVYRTYTDPVTGDSSESDVDYVRQALEGARRGATAPDRVYVLLANILLGRAGTDPTHLDFLARFQQLSGALTAKGVEDTVFYRYRRLIALNEVGGEPTQFGVDVDEFHARNAVRAQRHPAAMNTTATHDTKRGEDVRLRIAALTEMPDRWAGAVRSWRDRAVRASVDLGTANLVFQTLVGVWAAAGSGAAKDDLRPRVRAYLEKAVREAGELTTWVDPDADYEERVGRFIDGLLDDAEFCAQMHDIAGAANEIATVSGLTQVLLRALSPGVCDTYQGNELWDDSLVDPDNRRPVDFGHRAELLRTLDGEATAGQLWDGRHDGRIKLWVLRHALRLRRDRPELLTAPYQPLRASGPLAGHAVAFSRGDVVVVGVRLPGRVMGPELRSPTGDVWQGTDLELPEGSWRDVFTGIEGLSGDVLPLSAALAHLPVALLVRD